VMMLYILWYCSNMRHRKLFTCRDGSCLPAQSDLSAFQSQVNFKSTNMCICRAVCTCRTNSNIPA
jgi:hypothetical protein